MKGAEEAISVDSGAVVDDSDEVQFVMDSLAGDTFVDDSQVDFSELEVDAASALMHLQATEVSTFVRDREIQYVPATMFPVMYPHWYGLKGQHTNAAVTNLVWLSRGHAPSMLGVHEEDFGGIAFEDVIVPMWKIAYPSMFV